MAHKNYEEINSIQFGIYTPEEIEKLSVCEITSHKMIGNGSIYDKRMGILKNNELCVSCGKNNKMCPGHFGHINLNMDIIHPLFYKHTLLFLKCFCLKCSRLIISKEQIILNGFHKFNKIVKFNRIVEKCDKIDMCYHCNYIKPKIQFITNDNTFVIIHKNKNNILKTVLSDYEIKSIFDNIINEDIRYIGLNPDNIKPKNLIISKLLVLPPVDRPYVIIENMTCDDDITLQYIEIIKINNNLINHENNESKKNKLIQSLIFRIKCLFDNSQEKAKHSNGRPMKGIKKRISGKEGQMRNNCMGKRVNQSGRTVIGPDPTLRLDEMIVPEKIANILSYPERVNKYNIENLLKLIQNNKVKYIIRNGFYINLQYAMFNKGSEILFKDIILKSDGKKINVGHNINQYKLQKDDKLIRGGKILENIKMTTEKEFKLEYGDIVERNLKDGDIVLLNRQPTLHRGSMLAQKILVKPFKTFRLNLAITKTFNADFDGDEMNIHVPASIPTETELREIVSTKHNIISPQSSKPNIAIVQDGLLGAYIMTRENIIFNKNTFFTLINSIDNRSISQLLDKINYNKKVLKELGLNEYVYTSKVLFSMLLPDDFNYIRKNNANIKQPILKIYKGLLYEGTINKSIIGSSHNSIIQVLYKEYGTDIALDFINNIQFISYKFILYHGFTIGISDCIATKSKEITHVITRCFIEAKSNQDNIIDPNICEIKVNASLSKARDNGMKIAKDALKNSNNFISTVTSGSKGDYFNIAQITGLLGQQNLSGRRIPRTLNNNKRSLPHYSFNLSQEEEYESRGFIKNSFIKGLNPKEFWFHAITGREGITDTAMKTATSGYIQRRIIKLSEDIQVKYDSTVRNSNNDIIQFQYGDDNLDSCKTIILNEQPQICNIKRIVDNLNIKVYPEINRSITNEEIVHILSVIKASKCIPIEIKESVENNIKNKLYKQFNNSIKIKNESVIKLLKDEIERNYHYCQVQPGESVGIITGESIGERQTQMTLNTFHSAGLAIDTVLTGVPRFSELLNATKDTRSASCQIYTKEKCDNIKQLKKIIGNKIKQIKVEDIVEKYSYFLDGNYEEWYEEYKIMYDDNYKNYKIGIKLILNKKKMFLNNITIINIIHKIKEYVCAYTFNNNNLHVFFEESEDYDNIYYLSQIIINDILDIIICGIKNIVNIFYLKDIHNIWFITTKGTNLKEILKLDFVDQHNTISNYMWEINEIMGIEAARQFLIDEFKHVVSSDGAYINDRHIKILVDIMVQHGVICSISRYGMKRDNSGPIAKASFEQSLDNFIKAGFYGEKDNLNSVSSNIMCGKISKIGTGICDILQNFNNLN
jgi:DNA-directed RNA polymerase beta' subunit